MTTKPNDLRIALIGQAFMGKAHSNAWGQAGRFFDLPAKIRMQTICGRDEDQLVPFAERWGWENCTTDWREIVTNADIDFVDIGTPNDLHAEMSIAMLEAGKHVACEKPLAGMLEDARAMRDAARASDAKTFVWFNYRRCPAIALAYKWIREGRLGRVYHVRARYLQSWGGPDTPMLWRFQSERAGSGAHGDLNAHMIDLTRFLLGEEVAEVNGAIAKTFVTERTNPDGTKSTSDVDDCAMFLATMSGGATASVEATRLAAGHLNDNAIEINGELGSLRFSFDDMNALEVHEAPLGDLSGGWKRIVATSAKDHAYIAGYWPEGHWIGYEHGFISQAADIVRVLGGEAPELPLPDFEDAYETQRVLEAALVSARERCAIPLSQIL
ncbi:MAG: putative dehydrogenase [Planctomycetota bacterium]|jgi:predicted dehydrogenase